MNCPLCQNWGPDPNCGHYMLNGVQIPRGFGHRGCELVGRRAWDNGQEENHERPARRLEHIEHQCAIADGGGW